MKAISIRQPWAYLLANGHKDIENRNWNTKFRGEVLIHASKGMTKAEYNEAKVLCDSLGIKLPEPTELDFGCIVGRMTITDTVTQSDSPWFFGRVGFCISNARACRPVEFKGKLSFFETGLERNGFNWKRK